MSERPLAEPTTKGLLDLAVGSLQLLHQFESQPPASWSVLTSQRRHHWQVLTGAPYFSRPPP